MADVSCVKGESWRLRAGTPVPVCANSSQDCECTQNSNIVYVLQSFGVEKRTTRTYKATTDIAESTDFIGLNANAKLDSASYQATQYTDKDGNIIFSGQERELAEYVTEDKMPGVSAFRFE